MSGPKDCPSDSLLPHLEGAALSSRAVVWRLPLDHATRSEATNHFSYNIVKDPMHIRDFRAASCIPLGQETSRNGLIARTPP